MWKADGGSAKKVEVKELTLVEQIKEFSIGNDKVKLTRGNQSFDFTLDGRAESVRINYNYYESYDGDGQHSGAYIFRPKSDIKGYSPIQKYYYADGLTSGMMIL